MNEYVIVLAFVVAYVSGLMWYKHELVVLAVHALVLGYLVWAYRPNVMLVLVFVIAMSVASWGVVHNDIAKFGPETPCSLGGVMPLWLPFCWGVVGILAWILLGIA